MIFLKVNWRTAEDGRKDFGKYVINITHMHAYYERKLIRIKIRRKNC